MKKLQKQKKIECIKNLKRSVLLLMNFDKFYILISFLLKCLQGVIPIILILIMQKIINIMQISSGKFDMILQYLIVYMGISVFSNIVENVYDNYHFNFSLEFSNYLKVKMLEKSLELKLKDFERPEVFNVINRAQNQNSNTILLFVSSFFSIIQGTVSILGALYLLVRFCWVLSAFILLSPVICCFFTILIDKKWYMIRLQRTTDERKKWYINFLITTGTAIKEIKIFGLEKYFLRKYQELCNEIIEQDKMLYRKQTALEIICSLIEGFVNVGSYIYIFYLGYIRKILIGNVTTYIECVDNVKKSVQNIFSSLNDLIEESLNMDLLFEFLDLQQIESEGNKQLCKIEKIELRHISYRFSQETYILNNINININNNQTIAIIGENGSGKSTLIKILLGLYTDYEGEILINGVNIKEIDIKSYQKRLSVVFQDYIKYETSFRENIALGNIDLIEKDNIIKEILNLIHLDNKVHGQRNIDTILGNWFGDEQLSTGEWQRIAIGRSIIKNADIYLWDEPDSALDIQKQDEIIKLYNKITKKRWVFMYHIKFVMYNI